MSIKYIVGDNGKTYEIQIGRSAEDEIKKQRALKWKRWQIKYDTKHTHIIPPLIMEDRLEFVYNGEYDNYD